jgi:hypothetical protein
VRDAEERVLRGPKVEHLGKADTAWVLGLLRSGRAHVYARGFGTAREDGLFRIVVLASLDELSAIYYDGSEFTGEFRSS